MTFVSRHQLLLFFFSLLSLKRVVTKEMREIVFSREKKSDRFDEKSLHPKLFSLLQKCTKKKTHHQHTKNLCVPPLRED
jgi:hypothetical protein